MDKTTFTFNVRDMVEIAMLCALAIVLDRFLKIPLLNIWVSHVEQGIENNQVKKLIIIKATACYLYLRK